jgi:hypothetical protein
MFLKIESCRYVQKFMAGSYSKRSLSSVKETNNGWTENQNSFEGI